MALAEATVRVVLDVSRFEADLRQATTKAANTAGRQFDRDMRNQLRSTGRGAAQEFQTAARSSMGRAGANAGRDFETSFQQSVSKAASNIANRLSRQLRVSVGRAGLEAGRSFCDNFGTILANCGRTAGRTLGAALKQSLSQSLSRNDTMARDLTNGLDKTSPAAKAAGKRAGKDFSVNFGIGTSKIGGPLLATFAVLGAELATKVGPALGIFAAVPPLLTGITAAGIAAITIFRGFGDALKAASDPSDFAKMHEALNKLSPAAQAVILEYARMVPVLQDLRSQMQDAFFGRVQGQVTALADAFTGPLRGGILEVSGAMGGLTNNVLSAFSNFGGILNLQSVLRGTRRFVDQFGVGLHNLLVGFLDFSGAAAPGLNAVGRALDDLLTKWGDWMSQQAASGKALEWVHSGLAGMQELSRSLLDVWQVFTVLAGALKPISLLLSDVFGLAVKLVGVFGDLPLGLQTAALAAILFAKSGLPDILKRTTGETGAATRALRSMRDAYRGTATAAQAAAAASVAASAAATGAGAGAAGAAVGAGAAAGAAQAGAAALARQAAAAAAVQAAMSATASRFARDMQGPVGRAMGSTANLVAGVGNAIGNTMLALDRGLTGATVAAGRAAVALGPNMVRATKATASAALTVARAAQNAGDSFLFRMLPAALAASNAVQTVNVEARHFAGAVAQNTVRAVDAVTNSLRSGLYGGLVDAQAGLGRVSAAMSTGLMRGAIEADAAMTRMGASVRTGLMRSAMEADAAMTRLGTSVRTGLAQAVDAAGRGVANAGQAVANATSRFVAAVPPLNAARDAYRATTGELNAFAVSNARAATAVGAVPSLIGRARDSFAQLTTVAAGSGAALGAGFASAATSAATAVRNVTDRVVTSIGPLNAAREAYRSSTEQLRAMNAMHTQFVTSAGQAVGAGDRLRTTFSNMGVVIAGTGSVLRAGFDAPITAAKSAMTGLGEAAMGTGRAIASGIGSAVNGLMGALGGPWGLALTGATIGLSLFAAQSDKARQRQAEVDAAVSRLADTLDRQTGAVTANTTAQLANDLAKNDAGRSAQRLGISLSDVVKATSQSGTSLSDMTQHLVNSARGAVDASGKLGLLQQQADNLNVPLDTLIGALLGVPSALDSVGKASEANGGRLDAVLSIGRQYIPDQALLGQYLYNTAGALTTEGKAAADAAAATEAARPKVSDFALAMQALASKTGDASSKAAALLKAMQLLQGGSIDAEVAQANLTNTLKGVTDGLDTATKGLDNHGKAIVNTDGRLNTLTQTGAYLTGVYGDISKSLAESTTATVDAAQKSGDLKKGYADVAAQTLAARDAFIAAAQATGMSKTEAEKLATAYGLVPTTVQTLVTTMGTGTITLAEVGNVDAKLRALPPNTPVIVTALTDDAVRKLFDLGYKVTHMPDGTFKIEANDQPARWTADGFLAEYSRKSFSVNMYINQLVKPPAPAPSFPGSISSNPLGGANGGVMRYATGGISLKPMAANIAQLVPPNTWRVVGDRAWGDEAFIPINRSSRSRALLRYTADKMGYDLYGRGGINGSDGSSSATRSITFASGSVVVQAPYADPQLVARSTVNEIARSVPV